MRPGRFDRLIYIPPPDKEARREIFRIHTRKKPLGDDVNIDELAEKTEGYTGADIAAVCNEAVMAAIREYIQDGKFDKEKLKNLKIYKRHFEEALKIVKPLTKEELQRYISIAEKFEKEARQ